MAATLGQAQSYFHAGQLPANFVGANAREGTDGLRNSRANNTPSKSILDADTGVRNHQHGGPYPSILSNVAHWLEAVFFMTQLISGFSQTTGAAKESMNETAGTTTEAATDSPDWVEGLGTGLLTYSHRDFNSRCCCFSKYSFDNSRRLRRRLTHHQTRISS